MNRAIPWIAAAVALRLGLLAVLAQGDLGDAMCQFDCGWYERIAMHGYGSDTLWEAHGALPNWAFFPLYPALLRVVGQAMPVRIGGVLLSAGLFGLFLWVGLAYLRQSRVVVVAWIWVAAVLLFPIGIFFTAVYTEALFALLATICLATFRSRPWVAGLAAGLASAARPTGILLAPVVGLAALARAWQARDVRLLAPALLAPLGLVLYSAAQWALVGDPLAFSHQQALWNRVWVGPWVTIPQGLASWDLMRLPMAQSATWEAGWAVLGLLVAARMAWNRRLAEGWFLAACILLPASTGLDSLPRFIGTNPVFLFALHDALAPRPWRAVVWVPAFLVGFVWLATRWMIGAGGLF